MDIVRTVGALRQAVAGLKSIALVPTMGALHAGHLALMTRARLEADTVLASLFVNPAQFSSGEDFSNYPRDEDEDLNQLAAAGVDLIFAPSVAEMYPPGFATRIVLDGPAKVGLEDRFRPAHFQGVATVVTKLFLQSAASAALFGEKDYQQLRVIIQMTKDLDMPTRIISHETVREADGLALSSRNRYLSAQEREKAPLLYHGLKTCAANIRAHSTPERALIETREALQANDFVLDYLEVRDAETLLPAVWPTRAPARLLAAARLGATRLIDNIALN